MREARKEGVPFRLSLGVGDKVEDLELVELSLREGKGRECDGVELADGVIEATLDPLGETLRDGERVGDNVGEVDEEVEHVSLEDEELVPLSLMLALEVSVFELLRLALGETDGELVAVAELE